MAIEQAQKSINKGIWIDNYIYFYHTNTFIIIPEYADSVTDKLNIQFASTPILSRTAPIQSFSYAGPRSMSVQFNLHRDMMFDINTYNIKAAEQLKDGEDWVDFAIRSIQGAALPSYSDASKMVSPPLVALRLGDDIFIKGVVTGGVGITYKYPIISGRDRYGNELPEVNRYSNVDIAFDVTEVDPYDAETAMQVGSFRGLSTTLERRIQGFTEAIETTTTQSIDEYFKSQKGTKA